MKIQTLKIRTLSNWSCSLLVFLLILTGNATLKAQDNPELTPRQRANRALQQVDRHLRSYSTDEARKSLAPVLDEGRAEMLVALGRILEQEKNYVEAEKRLRRASDLAPQSSEPWLRLGSTLTYARQEEAAKAAYNKAVTLIRAELEANAEDPRIHYRLGIALRGAGHMEPAFNHLQRALELRPGMSEAFLEQGIVRFQQQQWQGAVELLTQAIERDANLAYAFYFRGYAASRIQRKDLTINDFHRFLEMAPNAPEALRVRRVVESL